MTRWTGAAGLLLVVLTSPGSPGAPQGRGQRGLRYGPHHVAVRRAAVTHQEVWYPATCRRQPAARPPCTAGTPDSGRFPLLVYATPEAGADANDSAAAAYFASHGYVVAWLPAHSRPAAARAAVASWPFVDPSRSALWRWNHDAPGEAAGPWRITVTAPRTGGAFGAAIAGSGGARTVALGLPEAAARRLAVVIGHALMDSVLRDWGGAPEDIARRLEALGLGP